MDEVVFRDWMRRQRVALDLTQEALAEEVGCAVQTVRAIEHGWRRPSRAMAERLATALAVPPAQRAAFIQAARGPLAAPAPPRPRPPHPRGPAPAAGATDPAAYLAYLADQSRGQLCGPDQLRRLAELDAELGGVRSALAWAFDEERPSAERVALGLQAASAIERYWHGRGHQAEGQRWLEQGLDLAERHGLVVDGAVVADALSSAGWLARLRGDTPRAMALLHRCVALYRTLDDPRGIAEALDTLGDLAIFEGDAVTAAWFFEESLALRRVIGDPRLVALATNGLGHAAVVRGYYERAAEHFRESLALLRPLGDPRSTALAHHGAGLALLRQGSLDEAAGHLGAALRTFAALDTGLDIALCLGLTGELLATQALTGAAEEHAFAAAARLWAAAGRLLEAAAVSLSPPERARRDALAAAARLRAGQSRFQAAWDGGLALDPAAAVAEALTACER